MPKVRHCVFVRFKPDVPPAEIDALWKAIASMRQFVPGLLDFSAGAYSSPEGLNKGFTHGFIVTFADEASRDTYLVHPEHEKIKVQALAMLDGGVEGVIAVDWLEPG